MAQQWEGDSRIVLFVVLAAGEALSTELVHKIQARVREGATPRHVPAKVIQVRALPHTRSGKLAELAVRAVIHGEPVRNRHALENPDCLAQFENIPALQTA